MTIPRVSISCDRFNDTLADFLERDVDEPTRAGMEAHALACAECGQLLADLRALRLTAANLPELAPSHDLWKGIAERIETPVVELKNGATVHGWNGGTQRRRQIWLGLAAAGLVAITATVTHELTKRSIGLASPANVASTLPAASTSTTPNASAQKSAPAPTPTAASVVAAARADSAPARRSSATPTTTLASNRPSAQQTYDNEIARLRIVVERRRPQLDSATVAVIEHNLKVIDDAIIQCKQALRKDPNSRFLMESLNDALDNKVQLLRTAATLPTKA